MTMLRQALAAFSFALVALPAAADPAAADVKVSFSAPSADASATPAKYNAGCVMTMVENQDNTVQMASLLP